MGAGLAVRQPLESQRSGLPEFAVLLAVFTVLEGIAVTGDPKFDIFKAAYPYCRQRAVEIFGWRNVATILGAAATAS